MGFGVPLRKWFDGPLREYIDRNLCSEDDSGKLIFDEKLIREFLADQRRLLAICKCNFGLVGDQILVTEIFMNSITYVY